MPSEAASPHEETDQIHTGKGGVVRMRSLGQVIVLEQHTWSCGAVVPHDFPSLFNLQNVIYVDFFLLKK